MSREKHVVLNIASAYVNDRIFQAEPIAVHKFVNAFKDQLFVTSEVLSESAGLLRRDAPGLLRARKEREHFSAIEFCHNRRR